MQGGKIGPVRTLLLTLVATCLSAQTASQRCLEYEPTVVHIDGRIQRQTFAGPPNYSSIKEGDERDVQWILHLSAPVCVNGKAGDELDTSESSVAEMQLVIGDVGDWNRYRPLLGKKVRGTGTLYHGFNGHHRTAVLLQVRLIEAQTGSPKK